MPRTRAINREEAISSGESNSIGENGTGYSEAWAQSCARLGRLGLLRLHTDIKLQVIDVMVQCLGGSLRRELDEIMTSRSKRFELTAISSSSFHSRNVAYATADS